MSAHILTGHDPAYGGPGGTDILVEVWDESVTVSLRPGRDQVLLTWGPPTELADGHTMHPVVIES